MKLLENFVLALITLFFTLFFVALAGLTLSIL